MEESRSAADVQSPVPPTRGAPSAYVVLGVLLVAIVVGAYLVKTGPERAGRGGEASQEASMKAGLDLLNTRNDPVAAAAEFRKVLARNSDHYGATFQLATALDRAGSSDEARPYWDKMLLMAEAAKDDATLAIVRARLAKASAPSEAAVQAAMMNTGLDALYRRQDPGAAVIEFRKVLERNPTHYGASFQLATALDRAGKAAEARPLWEKVLKMAEGYNDLPTLATARTRLAQKP
jgi:Tfp pilus assembly protein PilF